MLETLTLLDTREYLSQLRGVIPFLQEIPDDIYFKLDGSEFYLPLNDVADARVRLEEELGHYVMTYKRDVFNLTVPVDRHLCANLKGAELSDVQLETLLNYEATFETNRVSFVAYQNPVELIPPESSPLQRLYDERLLTLAY